MISIVGSICGFGMIAADRMERIEFAIWRDAIVARSRSNSGSRMHE
jgi:hypothetical protein